MGKYTIHRSEQVDMVLDGYFQEIIINIIEVVGRKNIKAIVLFGSFGRGEGGVIIDNKSVIPVNDFDLTVFINGNVMKLRKLHANALEKIAQRLAKSIGIKQIDLDLSDPKTLSFANLSVANYERLFGHKVLYGQINIRKRMRPIPNTKLPLKDGGMYFLTRGSGLLLAGFCIKKQELLNDVVISQNIDIEINKALLAIGDSYLIFKGNYHFSYLERLRIAEGMSFNEVPNGLKLKELYEKALKWKLDPVFRKKQRVVNEKEWKDTTNFFMSYFIWFESNRFNVEFKSWEEYSEKIFLLEKFDWNLFLRKNFLKIKSGNFKIREFINPNTSEYRSFALKLSIMSSLLCEGNTSQINPDRLGFVKQKLIENYGITTEKNWLDLTKAYLSIFHPNGLLNYISKLK